MSSITSSDNIGGSSFYSGGQGMWIFAFLVIFFIILFVILITFKGRDHRGGELTQLLPAAMLAAGTKHNCHNECDNARLWHDMAEEAGKTRHDIDVSTREIQHNLDMQSCETQKMVDAVIANQNRVALEAERQANARYIDGKNDKLAELRLALAEKDAKLLQQETLNAVGRSNCEITSKFDHAIGHVSNELTRIKDQMLKAPQYIPFGGVTATAPCLPMGCYS